MTLTLSVGVNKSLLRCLFLPVGHVIKWHLYSESLGIVWMKSERTRNVAPLVETHSFKKHFSNHFF